MRISKSNLTTIEDLASVGDWYFGLARSITSLSLLSTMAMAADVSVPGGGTITGAVTHASYQPEKAFDNSLEGVDRWLPLVSTLPNAWIQYQFDNGQQYIVTNLVIYSGSYTTGDGYKAGFPKDFIFFGSNDGSDWTNVLDVTGATSPSAITNSYNFPVTNPGAYEYYKLVISDVQTSNSTAYVRVSELEFDGYAPPGPPYIDHANGPISSGSTLATLKGRVVSTNGASLDAVRIYFGDNDGGTTAGNWDTNFVFTSVTESVVFSTNLTDLVFGRTYYYAVFASNTYGGAWSAVTNFTTTATNTVTLDVVADTYLTEGYPTQNNNNDPDDELILGWSPNSNIQRVLIRFDTSSISVSVNGSISVTTAVLKVTNRNANGSGDPNVGVYDYAYDFGETTATWNNPAGDGSDSTAGGTIGTLLTSENNLDDNANVSHTFDSSAAFQSTVEDAIAGDNTINLLLKRPNDTGTSADYIRFRDRDYPSGFFQLEVTYVLTLRGSSGSVFRFR